MNKQANASAKSKELQPTAQSQRFAAHLLLPQPHNAQTDRYIKLNQQIHSKKEFTTFDD